MPATYDKIATTTLSSAQSSVTFSSISGSYTDLVIVFNGKSAGTNQQISLQFNSDTGSNYSVTALYGDGSSAGSARTTSQTSIYGFGWVDTGNSTQIIHLQNYSNSTTFKTALGRGNTPSVYVHAGVGLWRSTSAITSVNIFLTGSQSFASGSTFNLYGVKAA